MLDFTGHLNDRELYRLIFRDILPAREKKIDWPNNFLHWDCTGANSDPEVWLRYYATEEEREGLGGDVQPAVAAESSVAVSPAIAARAVNETDPSSSSRSRNPYCTRCVRPGAIAYLFPPGLSAELLVERLAPIQLDGGNHRPSRLGQIGVAVRLDSSHRAGRTTSVSGGVARRRTPASLSPASRIAARFVRGLHRRRLRTTKPMAPVVAETFLQAARGGIAGHGPRIGWIFRVVSDRSRAGHARADCRAVDGRSRTRPSRLGNWPSVSRVIPATCERPCSTCTTFSKNDFTGQKIT